jgi:hypothetical protein
MIDNKILNHYAVWKAFHNAIYVKTLTAENLTNNGAEKYVDEVFKVSHEDGEYTVQEGCKIEKKCVFLDKGTQKYILPVSFVPLLPLNVVEYVECYLKKSDKTIYKYITKPETARISGIKTIPFKPFIHKFNNLESTDLRTWIFLKLQAIGSSNKGGKYRLCSNPGSGKNSTDTVLGYITPSVVRISKPSRAKFETLLCYYQKILPDEMTSCDGSEVKQMEPIVLEMADETPDLQKQSLARKKSQNQMDVSNTSLVFTYNRIEDVNKEKKFFDDIWGNIGALNDRYPALLLPESKLTGVLNKMNHHQAEKIFTENFSYYKEMAKNAIYFMQNLDKEQHGWNRDKIKFLSPTRHTPNFQCVLDAIDAYCDSQIEFDEWLNWINNSINRYQRMIHGITVKEPTEQLKVMEEYVT